MNKPIPATCGAAFLLLCLAAECPVVAQSCTMVGATAFGTWTKANSPYCVTTNVTVGALTIDAGVRVLIDPGKVITVANGLVVRGTEADPVLFTERSSGQGWGGIVFSTSNTPSTIEHCIIERSTNGGVTITNALPVFRHCRLRGNTTSANGGGMYASIGAGTLRLEDCVLQENGARGHGGGVFAILAAGATLQMDRCELLANKCNATNAVGGAGVQNWGGGLYISGDGALRNCRIRQNEAWTHAYGCSTQYGQGGGIYAGSGSLVIEHCVVVDNLASGQGAGSGCPLGAHGRGGAVAKSDGALTMRNSIIAGNRVRAEYSCCGGTLTRSGSGVWLGAAASAVMDHCTFALNLNHAIESEATAVAVTDSILYFNHEIAGNPPTYGAQMAGTITASHSDVHNGYAGMGNINADPFFLRRDLAIGGLVIHPVSPCVDAGDPAAPPEVAFPPCRGGSRSDMGAHGGSFAGAFTAPALMVGGAQRYGRGLGGANTLDLAWVPQAGSLNGRIVARGATPASPGALLIGIGEAEMSFGAATLLVDPAGLGLVPLSFDNLGELSLPFDLAQSALLGIPVHLQATSFPSAGLVASNGLVLLFY